MHIQQMDSIISDDIAPRKPETFYYHIKLALESDDNRFVEFRLTDSHVLGIAPELSVSTGLRDFGGQESGVSKYHALLSLNPQGSVQVADLNSTNGTLVNDTRLGPNGPLPLDDGDILTLGALPLRVSMLPGTGEITSSSQSEPVWALTTIAKALTSHLELDFILHHILQLARSMTAAKEALVWLMDDQTQELFLRAELGIVEEKIRHLRLPTSDPLVSSVLESGKPLRASRTISGEKIKIKTGYLVEAVLYVPLIVGAQKLGVLAAIHRDYDATFSRTDERLLAGIGDFAAIAIQNASIHHQVQEINRLKDEMIQNISHEFRTPLQYFRGYVSLMLDDREKVDPTHYEYLKVLDQQADRLRWLINNFISLDNSRRRRLSFVPIDLDYVLSSAVQGAQVLARERGIALGYREDDPLPVIKGNLSRLFEVVDNLLGNALKFTPAGGTVEVRSEVVEEEGHVLVHVQDSGIGIDPADQERIFERFYQVDGTSSRRHGGVGIGLAVCKAIIEEHNGHIWIDSAPGEGTTFTFSLPIMSHQELEKYA